MGKDAATETLAFPKVMLNCLRGTGVDIFAQSECKKEAGWYIGAAHYFGATMVNALRSRANDLHLFNWTRMSPSRRSDSNDSGTD